MAELVGELQQVSGDVTITAKAAEELRRIKANNGIPEAHVLRMGVKGGGCSGYTYVLAFDESPRDTDKVVSMEGLTVCIDPKSLPFLSGITLDFKDGLDGRGFDFSNPNATKTCGCGKSFCS